MDELTQAYHVLATNGFAATIASPGGGTVQADWYDTAVAYNDAFVADTTAIRKLTTITRTEAVRAGDFDAIFVVGGRGAMFDLPLDAAHCHILLEQRGAGFRHEMGVGVPVHAGNSNPLDRRPMAGGCTHSERYACARRRIRARCASGVSRPM